MKNDRNRRRKLREDIYDWRTANSTVALSALAYCGNETIMAGHYNDSFFVNDFIPSNLIYNKQYDVNGFIGVSNSEKAIYVVFRGSMTITNWLDDFETLMTSYPLCAQCSVHAGFYYSAQSVKNDVIAWVQDLQKQFPSYDVVVTGHSLGDFISVPSSPTFSLYLLVLIWYHTIISPSPF